MLFSYFEKREKGKKEKVEEDVEEKGPEVSDIVLQKE
jgi:hypothetical protein